MNEKLIEQAMSELEKDFLTFERNLLSDPLLKSVDKKMFYETKNGVQITIIINRKMEREHENQ